MSTNPILHVGYQLTLTPELTNYLITNNHINAQTIDEIYDPYFAVMFYKNSSNFSYGEYDGVKGKNKVSKLDPMQSEMTRWFRKYNKLQHIGYVKKIFINPTSKGNNVVISININSKIEHAILHISSNQSRIDIKQDVIDGNFKYTYDVDEKIPILCDAYICHADNSTIKFTERKHYLPCCGIIY
jgi:hypothetical protein